MGQYKRLSRGSQPEPRYDVASRDKSLYCLIAPLPHCLINNQRIVKLQTTPKTRPSPVGESTLAPANFLLPVGRSTMA